MNEPASPGYTGERVEEVARSMRDRVDAICKHAYTLALLLAALTVVLTPLHVIATQRGNVTRVLADNTVELSRSDLPSAQPGDRVQVYRFNPHWMKPIGEADVVQIRGDRVVLRYDPVAYAWPMGIQGTVASVEGDELVLNVGSGIGVTQGQALNLFDAREQVGSLQITSVSTGSSRGRLLNLRGLPGAEARPGDAIDLTVSPYVIPNQVGLFAYDWFGVAEVLAIVGTFALWIWTIRSPVPGARLAWLASNARTATRRASMPVKMILWAILGFLVCWVGVRIAAWFWISAPQLLWDDIRAIEQYVPFIPSGQLAPQLPVPDLSQLPNLLMIAAMAGWLWLMVSRRANPLSQVLEFFRFRRMETPVYRLFGWMRKDVLNWLLHWAVFYVFARNLLGFLKNNMAAAAGVGWAEYGLPFDTWSDWFSSSLFMLTHMPTLRDAAAFFDAARFLTWSACIVGCLIGYGHTIFSILWKPDAIRWVDFTAVGWMVNLLCYGAWAGAVFKVFSHPAGADPAVTAGPLAMLMPATELFLNVVYTLSIFNMGTKFGIMVDKGLVDRGFYSVVRHPTYTLEPLMFVVLYMNRVTDPLVALGLLAFPFMYWWRSERDDHFMGQANPDYPGYRERVRYKFVRGVW